MDGWTIVRLLHILGFIFFVGGQMAMIAAVSPVLRTTEGGEVPQRRIAIRFGIGSAVALVLLLVTGLLMADHFARMGDPLVHAKLLLLAAIFVMTALHTRIPYTRLLSLLIFAASVAMVVLGVQLAHGG